MLRRVGGRSAPRDRRRLLLGRRRLPPLQLPPVPRRLAPRDGRVRAKAPGVLVACHRRRTVRGQSPDRGRVRAQRLGRAHVHHVLRVEDQLRGRPLDQLRRLLLLLLLGRHLLRHKERQVEVLRLGLTLERVEDALVDDAALDLDLDAVADEHDRHEAEPLRHEVHGAPRGLLVRAGTSGLAAGAGSAALRVVVGAARPAAAAAVVRRPRLLAAAGLPPAVLLTAA
mmetsp:Transcript_22808/g.48214  ORF Transcript_22808/g.48214 Transcript_22808/m.48214 type:complete len:226 (+) Transcript_22808:403-1080(+)